MILTSLGKEFIIINEEIAIYLSFLIVLSLLVSNFGQQLSKQFLEQANTIAQNYSQGSQERVKDFAQLVTANYNNINFLLNLINLETAFFHKLLNLKQKIVNAVLAAEYKLA